MKTLRKQDNETRLQRAVRLWLNSKGKDYNNGWKGAYDDLMQGGCASGVVSELVYYTDTLRFYNKHKAEINNLLAEHQMHASSLNGWDACDPLALEPTNQNLLAWFWFEETAYQLAEFA
jgi:hypothetical protein